MSNVKTGKTIETINHKKTGVILYFQDGAKLALSHDSYTEIPLYEGKILSEKEYRKLETLSKADLFYAYALKMCFGETKTKKEVADKLKAKGASREVVKSILSRLQEAGLVDDRLYAKVYAEDIASLRCYGRKRVLYELKKKGVAEEIIGELAFPRNVELEKAKRYGESLNRRDEKVPNAKKKLKMLRALMERGFDEDIAHEAVEDVATENDPDQERNALAKDYFSYKIRYERKYEGYELREKLLSTLLKKGYRYEDIKEVEAEGEEHDDD